MVIGLVPSDLFEDYVFGRAIAEQLGKQFIVVHCPPPQFKP
jgi:hypothetical protein